MCLCVIFYDTQHVIGLMITLAWPTIDSSDWHCWLYEDVKHNQQLLTRLMFSYYRLPKMKNIILNMPLYLSGLSYDTYEQNWCTLCQTGECLSTPTHLYWISARLVYPRANTAYAAERPRQKKNCSTISIAVYVILYIHVVLCFSSTNSCGRQRVRKSHPK